MRLNETVPPSGLVFVRAQVPMNPYGPGVSMYPTMYASSGMQSGGWMYPSATAGGQSMATTTSAQPSFMVPTTMAGARAAPAATMHSYPSSAVSSRPGVGRLGPGTGNAGGTFGGVGESSLIGGFMDEDEHSGDEEARRGRKRDKVRESGVGWWAFPPRFWCIPCGLRFRCLRLNRVTRARAFGGSAAVSARCAHLQQCFGSIFH